MRSEELNEAVNRYFDTVSNEQLLSDVQEAGFVVVPRMTSPKDFTVLVDKLIARSDLSVEERIKASDALIEEYYATFGDVPPSRELSRLADWIDEAALKSNNKRHYDRPVYTEKQLRRKDRQLGTFVDLNSASNLTYHDTQLAREYAAEVAYNSIEQRITREIKKNPKASNREIARRLGIDDKTVAKYR